jgi:hypothetical protein
MIRLTSAEQARSLAGHIPQLAVTRMEQFEGTDGRYDPAVHGHIVVLEPGDDIAALPEIGANGLIDVIDAECPGYEYIDLSIEDGRRVYEMVIAIDADQTIALIIPDHPSLDGRLRLALEAEIPKEQRA